MSANGQPPQIVDNEFASKYPADPVTGEPTRCIYGGVTRGRDESEIIFALFFGGRGGVYERRLDSGDERRIIRKNHAHVQHMDRHPLTGALIYSLRAEQGTVRLSLNQVLDGVGREVTEGDTRDDAPTWVQGKESTIVYQSTGLARDSRGNVVEASPCEIIELDLHSTELRTLISDDRHDLLEPHKLADGSLFFIRRPYRSRSIVRWFPLFAVALFPVRIAFMAGFCLKVIWRLIFNRPAVADVHTSDPDLKRLVWWSRLFHDDALAQRRGTVPKSWQLIRRAADGSETVVAKAVLGYDVASDGSVIFTDGRAIYRCVPGGKPEKVLDYFPIEKVTALD